MNSYLDTLLSGDIPREWSFEPAEYDARIKALRGRMAARGIEVLLATDTRLKRKVAIKRVLGDLAGNQTAVRRFLTEAQSIAALSNHPNIVDIYDFGRDQDGPFLIMEYIDGGCLLDRCQDGPLPLEEAVDLTCKLCGALEMAHEAGIIHRDIKPANVLLTKNGIPALTDFGLAKDEVGDTGHTMAGAVLGTLDFMPPEQRRDAAEVDARSDLWSLAATLYQMVTGESPRVIDLDAVPKQLRQTFAKALRTKKDDRYQTVREFRDALRDSQQPLEQIAGLLSKRVVDTDGQEGGQDIFHGTEVGETVPALAVKPPIRTPGQPRLAAEAERLLKVGKTAIRKAHDYVAGHNPSQASRQSTDDLCPYADSYVHHPN